MRTVAMVGGTLLLVLLLLAPAGPEAWTWQNKADNPEATTTPAAEAAKEATKEAIRDAADAAKETGESIKQTVNAAYQTTAEAAAAAKEKVAGATKTVNGGRKDERSTGAPGAAYRDATGKYVEDTVSSAREKAADATEAVKEAAARASETVQETTRMAVDKSKETLKEAGSTVYDTAATAGEKVSQATAATKDATITGAQSAREGAGRAYDATAGTLGAAGNKVSDTVGNTKQRVCGKRGDEPRSGGVYDAAGNYYESAKEMAARTGETVQGHASYAGQKLSETAQAAADAARRAGQSTRDSAANAYGAASGSLGYGNEEKETYGTKAYESASNTAGEYYEGAKNKLGSIIEILGWHKVAQDEHSMLKNFSPYDIIVGNTKYVWHQKPGGLGDYYQSAKDTVGGYASRVTDGVSDAAGRATEGVKDVTGRATDTLRDTHKQTTSSASEYSQRGKEALGAGAAAIGLNKLGGKMGRKGGFFREFLRFLHLVTFSTTFGSAVWMTFISGALLSKSIPREQFRSVQSKMFPFFLKFVTGGELGLVLLYSFLNPFSAMNGASRWQLLNLVFLLASTAFNAFVLEPETTKIYFERLKLEKEEGRGLADANNFSEKLAAKKKKFHEVHGFSTVLNLVSLVGLTIHAWHLAHRLTL